MFYYALIFFSLIFLIVATITDIKTREISNKLILFFLVFGIVFKALWAFLTNNPPILYLFLLSIISSFIFFLILWELGVIAGGDLKLFLVLAIMIPNISLPFNIPTFLFPVILFFISLFMVLPWLLIYSLYFIFKKKYYKEILKELFSKPRARAMCNSFLVVFLLSGVFSILYFLTPLVLLVLSFLAALLIYRFKGLYFYVVLFISYIGLASYMIFTKTTVPFSLSFVLSAVMFLFLFSLLSILYKTTKSKILIEHKKINALKEGDLLLYNYYFYNKKIKLIKPTALTKIKMLIANTYYKNLKIDSSYAGGINAKDILFLKYLYKNNLINNKIVLKKTLAFVPAVLLSYIFMILMFWWFY